MSEQGCSTPGRRRDGESSATTGRLPIQFRRSDLARHLAFFYDSPEWQRRVAAAFVEAGLDRDNRCLYFLDSNTRSTVETALRAAGIDVDTRVDAGDLQIRAGSDAYREAAFDPGRLVTLLEEAVHESAADAYDGLWVAGEVSWCFHTDLDYDHVVEFEAEFDAVCPDLPVTSLCQYDLNRFSEESVAKALWTHRQVVYRDSICENPFYVSPDEYRSTTESSVNASLMLEQAYRLTEATRQVERREQRLAVVDRVLRHDVRNHLNVVRGVLEQVRGADWLDDEHATRVATATDHVDRVVQTATNARFVQRTLEASNVGRLSLSSVVDDAVERVASDYPSAELSVAGDTDVTVVADQVLDVALAELFAYALGAQDAPGRVGVRVADDTPDGVHLDVTAPGSPVPRNARRALRDGLETPLNHCTGLGLWLVKWTVENGGGSVEFPATADEPVRLRLERAPVDC
ncbi:MEDS domain-containing protein [Salinigranum sp.]|uniref:MEDS domain-containing protein n=1 Tax=Salinigranum sp. TaxID=1966351 RepID=UPI0035691DB2